MIRKMSMQGIVSWLGISSIVFFFTSITFFGGWRLTKTVRDSLSRRAFEIAETLGSEVEESVLIDDKYSAYRSLKKVTSGSTDILYAFIRSQNDTVFAHTFKGGFPKQLLALNEDRDDRLIIYSTPDNRIMDVCFPLLDGQLGTLHLGVSQEKVFHEQRFFIFIMSGILIAAMGITFIIAQQIGAYVGKPLRQLTEAAKSVPSGKVDSIDIPTEGTVEVRSLSLAFRDMVDDLRRLESENLTAQRRMVSAERLAALGELSAGLAHEIMNPLDGVLEGCRHIKTQISDSDRLARYLLLMESGLVRIERVMRQMLEYAKGPEIEPQLEKCDMEKLIREISELAYPQIRIKKVKLNMNCKDSLSAICDRHLVGQALLNLVLNAADASEGEENATIVVALSKEEELIQIGVGDSGPGVPENMREKIFTPFFTTKDPDKGTGLGLAMARQAIQQCGGDLYLDTLPSTLGGAQFYINLPSVSKNKY